MAWRATFSILKANPEVFPAFQNMWVYLQQRLISSGCDEMTTTEVVFNLPASMSTNSRHSDDPVLQRLLSMEWSGQVRP